MSELNDLFRQAVVKALLRSMLGDEAITELEESGAMPDHHAHKCENCGNIWEHDRPPFTAGPQAYEEAHTCSKCGAEQYERYFGTH